MSSNYKPGPWASPWRTFLLPLAPFPIWDIKQKIESERHTERNGVRDQQQREREIEGSTQGTKCEYFTIFYLTSVPLQQEEGRLTEDLFQMEMTETQTLVLLYSC